MSRIVTITLNPAIDKSCSVEQVVAEKKLRCGLPIYYPGGGGLNVARAILNLGGMATAYWTCGGPTGNRLRKLLDSYQMEHYPITITEETRENLIVYESSSDRRFRFGMPGGTLRTTEIERISELIKTFDPFPQYLVFSGSLPPGTPPDIFKTFVELTPDDCRVILDTSGEPLRQGIQAKTFLIKPNLLELERLHGSSITTDAKIRQVTEQIVHSGKAEVVVTSLGANGAVLASREIYRYYRSPTVRIRSRVGAGDSMVAGIVLALSRGMSIEDSVRYGVASGAAAVMTTGTELCRRQDTDRLHDEMLLEEVDVPK